MIGLCKFPSCGVEKHRDLKCAVGCSMSTSLCPLLCVLPPTNAHHLCQRNPTRRMFSCSSASFQRNFQSGRPAASPGLRWSKRHGRRMSFPTHVSGVSWARSEIRPGFHVALVTWQPFSFLLGLFRTRKGASAALVRRALHVDATRLSHPTCRLLNEGPCPPKRHNCQTGRREEGVTTGRSRGSRRAWFTTVWRGGEAIRFTTVWVGEERHREGKGVVDGTERRGKGGASQLSMPDDVTTKDSFGDTGCAVLLIRRFTTFKPLTLHNDRGANGGRTEHRQ